MPLNQGLEKTLMGLGFSVRARVYGWDSDIAEGTWMPSEKLPDATTKRYS